MAAPDPTLLRAVTLDLDDTVWPYAPVAARMGAALGAFLAAEAPATRRAFDEGAFVGALCRTDPGQRAALGIFDWLSADGLRRRLVASGEDPALAAPAADVVFAARQEVDPYPDALDAIARLRGRFAVGAVTNGSADLHRIGLSDLFDPIVTSRALGVAKPDGRIFAAACGALGCAPAEVLHGGDDLEKDVRGALASGLQAAWVHRDAAGTAPGGAHHVRDLAALADLLGV